MRQIYNRIWNTMMRLAQENPGETIAVTSRGCAIRNFLYHAVGWSIEQLNGMDWSDNIAVNIVDFGEERNVTVRLKNDVSHLTEESTCAALRDWTRRN